MAHALGIGLDLHPGLDLARAGRHEDARALDLDDADAADVDRREVLERSTASACRCPAARQASRIVVPAGHGDGRAVDRELDVGRASTGGGAAAAGSGGRAEDDLGQRLGGRGLSPCGVCGSGAGSRLIDRPRVLAHRATSSGCRSARLDRRRRRLAEAADRRVAHRLADVAQQASSSSRDRRPSSRPRAARAAPPGARCRPGTGRTGRTTRRGRTGRSGGACRPGRRSRRTPSRRPSRASRRSRASPRTSAACRARRGRRRRPPRRRAGRPERAAARDAAGELEQLPQRRAERDLVDAGPRDVAATGRTASGRSSPPCRSRAKASAPPSSPRMSGTLTSVSTLLTAVGLPNSPTSTGNGGLLRGSPRLPSIDSKSAVSSPQM